jgi:hypothetical protein
MKTEQLELTFRMPEKRIMTKIEKQHPDFAMQVMTLVNASKQIHDGVEYESLIGKITAVIKHHSSEISIQNKLFINQMALINDEELDFEVKDWGGVAYQKADVKKHIREKYLLVRQSIDPIGTLWLEYHKEKHENLTFKAGYSLITTSEPNQWERGQLSVAFAGPNDKFTLNPGNVHGIIALTDLAVFEQSDSSRKHDIYSIFPKPVQLNTAS